jgi:hypothetical protein
MTIQDPLGQWAVAEGLATERVVARALEQGLDLRVAERQVGAEILSQLRRRGLRVRLDGDGRPLVGPRDLVTPADLELLRSERAAVLAALRREQEGERA